MTKLRTHYDNLKVARNAPTEVIRAAYKVLCQKHHPDRNNNDPDATRIMKIINEAYDVLSDPIRREEHDKWIKSQEKTNDNTSYHQQKEKERAQREAYAREQAQREAYAREQAQRETYAREQAQKETWAREQAQWAEAREQALQELRREEQSKKSNRGKTIIFAVLLGSILLLLVGLLVQMQSNNSNTQHNTAAISNSSTTSVGSDILASESDSLRNPSDIAINEEIEQTQTYLTSFDCRKAKSLTENLICQNEYLAKADRELSDLVKKARASVSDQEAFTRRLRQQWNYREKNCKDVACLSTWFAYQQDILGQIVATGDVNAGLPKPKLKPEPLPSTGDKQAADFDGVAPLKIRVPHDGDHYFIKIEDTNTQQNLGNYFIRSGDTLNIDLPIGSYKIKYAYGKQWYGVANLFGEETKYAKANQTFDFSFDGYQYNGYTIELIKQENGNLRTSNIDKNQF